MMTALYITYMGWIKVPGLVDLLACRVSAVYTSKNYSPVSTLYILTNIIVVLMEASSTLKDASSLEALAVMYSGSNV